MRDVITLTSKEIARFFRVWKQTLIPPVITTSLYLLIFGKFIWDRINIVDGIAYIDFIFPGLLMMSVIMAAYQNTSSSFFGSKFQKSIEELFVSPISYPKIMFGFCTGAVLRALIVWLLVFIVGYFMADVKIYNYFYTFVFLILGSFLFALMWLFNGIFAKSFDDIAIIPTFVITPLIYLGWVFYSIELLSPFWQWISLFNPILYMVNGLRFGMIGFTDINVITAIGILVVFIVVLSAWILYLLKKGYGIRS